MQSSNNRSENFNAFHKLDNKEKYKYKCLNDIITQIFSIRSEDFNAFNKLNDKEKDEFYKCLNDIFNNEICSYDMYVEKINMTLNKSKKFDEIKNDK